jgi:hypothetical protein
MSGTNVWLKLRDSSHVTAQPYLLAPPDVSDSLASNKPGCTDSAAELTVWRLPYAGVLRHTVEEVVEACERVLDPQVGGRQGKSPYADHSSPR